MTGGPIPIRTLWYKLKHQYVFRNASFGPGTIIKCRLSIKGPGRISIGSDCLLLPDAFGDDFVSIHTHRPGARVVIGDRVILRATRFGCHRSIEIGDGAVIECASIFDSDFHSVDPSRREESPACKDREVTVGEGSYIGCDCICSKGTGVGRRAILLAGTVIGTKMVPDDALVGGNPARILSRPELESAAVGC